MRQPALSSALRLMLCSKESAKLTNAWVGNRTLKNGLGMVLGDGGMYFSSPSVQTRFTTRICVDKALVSNPADLRYSPCFQSCRSVAVAECQE